MMNRRQRRYLDCLRRRRNFLADRITTVGSTHSYDKAELAALNWAIAIAQSADLAGVLNDLDTQVDEARKERHEQRVQQDHA